MNRHLEQQANIVEEVLSAHGFDVHVAGGTLSPRLVHFSLALGRGLRLSGLTPALPDLAHRLQVDAVRLAPDTETGLPTLEVPRPDPVPVRLLPLARTVAEVAPPCTATLGRDVAGSPILLRLDAPEVGPVLIGGGPDSGKSSLLRAVALSLSLHNGPDTLRLLLIDLSGPARRGSSGGTWNEMSRLPHLVGDVVRESQEAKLRLRWAARLAAGRAMLAAEGEPIEGAHLVVMIDGLDAVLAGRDAAEMETALRAVAGGRDLGVQLVAAGRPGGLGAVLNWGARVVGRVPDAATAVEAAGVRGTGAEGLLGKGDFLVVLGGDVIRMQAGFATDTEVSRTVSLLAACASDRLPAAPLETGTVRALRPSAARADEPPGRRGLWKAHRQALRLLKSGS